MTKLISLRGKVGMGLVTLVDDDDFALLSKYKWCARKYTRNGSPIKYYVVSGIEGKVLQMHRFILGIHTSSYPIVDHKNGNTLDNQKKNLRICSNQQNSANRISKNKFSKYKGIRIINAKSNPSKIRWEAFITVNKKQKYLGSFDSEIEAARAYDLAAKKFFGEYARLNLG